MHGWFGVEVSPAISSLFGFVRRFESPDLLRRREKYAMLLLYWLRAQLNWTTR